VAVAAAGVLRPGSLRLGSLRPEVLGERLAVAGAGRWRGRRAGHHHPRGGADGLGGGEPDRGSILALAIAGGSSTLDLPAPGFTLTDQNGRTVSLAQLRGKVVLMTFLDPVCTTDCPIIAQEFKQAGEMLGAQDSHVELVAVVANPSYRSIAFTRAFDRQEGLATVPNWLYLTGPLSQLGAVWRQYGVTVQNLPAGAMSAHNDLAVVIDASGQIRQEVGADPGRARAAPSPLSRSCSASTPARPWATRDPRPDPAGTGRPGAWGFGLAVVCAGLAAGCGTQTARTASASPPTVAAPLSTALVTAQGTWAITVMGGSGGSDTGFWQLFARPAGASRWSLVTPPGVADNGGLVAAGGNTSLLVGFRPSQSLSFSPLAISTDTGRNWTPGLLDARLADTAGAIAVEESGRILALRQDGSITAAATASAAAAGQWSPLDDAERPRGVRPGSRVRAAGVERAFVRPK